MKYTELKIETQRQAPAHVRSEGESVLRRSGYTRSDGAPTPLGSTMHVHLADLCQAHERSVLFGLLGLPVLQTEDGESFFATPSGRQEILQCPACLYASRREVARFRRAPLPAEPMAPLQKVETPGCNTIESLAGFLDIPKERTAKALMFTRTSDLKFVFVVVRGDSQMSEEKLRRAVGDFRLATADEISASGAAAGYASPIGLRQALIVVDELIPISTNLVAGANEAGFHFRNTNYTRDYGSAQEADLILAEAGDACPNCGGSLESLEAELVADSSGYRVGTILEALAEVYHDEKGLCWPVFAAPFDVYLLHLPGKELDTLGQAQGLSESWETEGISVLFDDRDARAGVKFNDADLIGCPIRATVGERALKDGMVELKARTSKDTQLVPIADAARLIQSLTTTRS